MNFDVKFDGQKKARCVAGGHLTVDPGEDSYSGVVTPEAVRLDMMAAVTNNLNVLAADIGNACKDQGEVIHGTGGGIWSINRQDPSVQQEFVWSQDSWSKISRTSKRYLKKDGFQTKRKGC